MQRRGYTLHEEREEFLVELRKELFENPFLTRAELAERFNCSEEKIYSGMLRLSDGELTGFKDETGLSFVERHVVYDIAELLAINPTLNAKDLMERTGLSLVTINDALSHITKEDIEYARLVLIKSGKGGLVCLPDFVPKSKIFIDKSGKKHADVSEFFGIVENGGECYRNVRFVIPNGTLTIN